MCFPPVQSTAPSSFIYSCCFCQTCIWSISRLHVVMWFAMTHFSPLGFFSVWTETKPREKAAVLRTHQVIWPTLNKCCGSHDRWVGSVSRRCNGQRNEDMNRSYAPKCSLLLQRHKRATVSLCFSGRHLLHWLTRLQLCGTVQPVRNSTYLT